MLTPSAQSFPQQTISNLSKSTQRIRTKRDYAITARALDYGNLSLPPTVIRTYRVLCDLDFADRSTRRCKGYIWYATETIAQYIGCTTRTIQRHLRALEHAGLIVRERRERTSSLVRLNVLVRMIVPAVDKSYPQTTTVSSPYKGNKETSDNTPTSIQYYAAKWDDAVTQLISFGYDTELAIRDCVQFGREELLLQIQNLYAYMRQGKSFHSYARWLNWAIRAKHRVDPRVADEQLRQEEQPEAGGCVEVDYELVVDAEGYATYQPKQDRPERAGQVGAAISGNTYAFSPPVAMPLFTPSQPEEYAMISADKSPCSVHQHPLRQSIVIPVQARSTDGKNNRNQPPPAPHPLLAAQSASYPDHTHTASLHTAYVVTVVRIPKRVRQVAGDG